MHARTLTLHGWRKNHLHNKTSESQHSALPSGMHAFKRGSLKRSLPKQPCYTET